jgi:hypothetical protein
VAVAMFGHTGLGMLICRNEYFIRAHIYALTGKSPYGNGRAAADPGLPW